VPDVLSSFNPTAFLHVVFKDPTTNYSLTVTPGQNTTIDQVQNQPQFYLTFNDTALETEAFVVIMVDANGPSPSNTALSQVPHILAGDFHWNSISKSMSILVAVDFPCTACRISSASGHHLLVSSAGQFLHRRPDIGECFTVHSQLQLECVRA